MAKELTSEAIDLEVCGKFTFDVDLHEEEEDGCDVSPMPRGHDEP